MRLIGADGEQLDIVSLTKARELALQAGLDLVLVSDPATPPVVRIMDYGKLLFEQTKNLKNQYLLLTERVVVKTNFLLSE